MLTLAAAHLQLVLDELYAIVAILIDLGVVDSRLDSTYSKKKQYTAAAPFIALQ